MRYNSVINNIKAKEWDLTIQQAYLFSWFYELPSWANKVMIENEIFYFASKNKAVEELPILTDKLDTMYRYYKQLEEKELIVIKKIDNKDYISLTSKGKEWNLYKSDYSENNPTLLGNLSENNSENNPTYNNTIYNNKESNNSQTLIPNNSLKTNTKEKRETKLFVDSIWNDFEAVKEYFISRPDLIEKYAYCDLKYYINKVDTWSENSGKKRTDRGWIGTIIDFIDKAKIAGNMQSIRKPEKQTPKDGHINY